MTGDIHITADTELVVRAAIALLRAALEGAPTEHAARELRYVVAQAEIVAQYDSPPDLEQYATPAAALELET